jgi:hypothetical protein
VSFRTLAREDRRLVIEAGILCVFVYVGLRTLSFASLRRSLDACSRRVTRDGADNIARVAWAVEAACRRIPGGRTCLIEALTADVMLRRRGYRPVLHLGIRKPTDRTSAVTGHAWVVCDNRVVVGGVVDLGDYTPVSPTSI